MNPCAVLGLPGFHRLTDLPAVPQGDRSAADLAQQLHTTRGALLPALAGAHAAEQAIAVAWIHPAADADMQILIGGGIEPEHTTHQRDRDQASLIYPPGAHGMPLPEEEITALFGALPFWVRCGGAADPLAVEAEAALRLPDAVFDDYASALLDVPYGWLVLAEPLDQAAVQRHLGSLSREVPRTRGLSTTSESQRVALERAQVSFRELSRAAPLGLWRIHILAGGAARTAAARVAGLLSAAADTTGLPYLIRPRTQAADFTTSWRTTADGTPEALDASPFVASTELLAAIARPPVKEIRGLRMPPAGAFDITPEHTDGLHLGTVLDRELRPASSFRVTQATLNRHVFVCGATGSGKSQTVRSLLEGLHREGVPWLVIEPAKAEYARMAGRLAPDEVLLIRPGAPHAVPGGLNPLEPEPGFPLQTHLDLVRALFLAAFKAEEPFPQVLSQALHRCYTALGWNLTTGTSIYPHATPRYPTLEDLRSAGLATVAEIGYGTEVAHNVRGFIDVRLKSLQLGTPGRFFIGGHRLNIAELLCRNIVLELEDIGNDQDKAFLIGTVLIRLAEHLRLRAASTNHGSPLLRHVTVVEEAHRLLRATAQDSPAAHAVELFAALLAEIRAYGEGIVVAEQIPSKVTTDLVKNTALKIMHRLPAADDRAVVGATMNLSPQQAEYVVTLPPGQAAVFADGMDRPVLVRMPYGEDRENTAPATTLPPLAALCSACCGPLCRERPCSLAEIDLAARLAEQHTRLALWIEIITIAHVIGRSEPIPTADWIKELAQDDRRILDCSLGQLAQNGVERRYTALLAHYQPEDLASHVATRARAWLAGDIRPCAGEEFHWQAGQYRWTDIAQRLAHGDHDRTLPHPLTDVWFQRGLDLRGVPAVTQLHKILNQPASRPRDRTVVDGTGTPPEHARLAGLLSSDATPWQRFAQATDFLAFASDWPLRHLYPKETRT